jgi:hypothetical protein
VSLDDLLPLAAGNANRRATGIRDPGKSGYPGVSVGVAFVACRMGEVRRTPAVRRRRLTLLRLTLWVAARKAAVAPSR